MMRMIALAALAAVSGWAATGKNIDRPGIEAGEKDLLTEPALQWLKVYQLPINREVWRLEGALKSLDQDLPRVRDVFAKVGAAQAGAVESSGKTRRFSYRCSKDSARKALAELKKLGTFAEPSVHQIVEPVSRVEVQGKIKALETDKAGHAGELAKMPAVSALVEELLGHLRGVDSALSKPEVEVLVHLTVKEKS